MDTPWLAGLVTGIITGIVLSALCSLYRHGRRQPRFREAVTLAFDARLFDKHTGLAEEVRHMFKVTPGKDLHVRLTPKDADGQPAALDTQDRAITFTASAPEVTVTPDVDGLGALYSASTGFRGVSQIQAEADADLDAGEERLLTALDEAEWVGGEAVTMGMEGILQDKT